LPKIVCYTKTSGGSRSLWICVDDLWNNEMDVLNKTRINKSLFLLLLTAAMIVSSCNPKATHLTQNLENSRVPGQASTQTPEEASGTPGLQTLEVPSPSPVYEPSETSAQLVASQTPLATVTPALTRTSSPTGQAPIATTKSSTPQIATLTRTHTSTSTLTTTATTTKTATPTLTSTLQTGWEGEWIAYLEQSDGTYRSGVLTVTISGDSVTGVFDNAGVTMNLEGFMQTDGITVSGDYTLPGASGWFKWVIQENTYIIGNIDNEWAFCAAREGSPQPDPCGYFDPS